VEAEPCGESSCLVPRAPFSSPQQLIVFIALAGGTTTKTAKGLLLLLIPTTEIE
jgi:hypothetical protein